MTSLIVWAIQMYSRFVELRYTPRNAAQSSLSPPPSPSYLENHQQYAIALIPLFAFLEACIGIGLFVSGIFLVIVCTLVFTNQIASIELIGSLASLGALCGDHVGFYFGQWLGPRFHHLAFARKHQSRISRTESLIQKYGSLAILIGRFIPAIRSIVPTLCGLSGFAGLRYSLVDVVACLFWASALALLVTGADSLI